jgi:hypothetical protein
MKIFDNIQDKIIRFSIVFIFIVFGVWEFIAPQYWVVFVPKFVSAVFNPLFATRIHGLLLISLGIFLILEFKKFIISIISTLIMLSVVISVFIYYGFSDTLVRDIVILLCTSSLILSSRKNKI